VAAFAAVTHEELLWCCEGCGELDLATLAAAFHACGVYEQESDYLTCECRFPERSNPISCIQSAELVLSSITEAIIDHLRFGSYNTTRVCVTYMDVYQK